MDALFMALAAAEAEKYIGATAPNPPVGACLVKDGKLIALGAHARAGTGHAEIVALQRALEKFGVESVRGATLYVTLEPCNHEGKTPPCTQAIVAAGITRVVYGVKDPNRMVEGHGAEFLSSSGIRIETGIGTDACKNLIAPFAKWTRRATPWVVHKMAWRILSDGTPSMLPEANAKTFTSDESLRLAHIERRKSDAILTGLNTVLIDHPLLNVRQVPDHESNKRYLAVLSQSKREIPKTWLDRQTSLGFQVLRFDSIESALSELGQRGCQRVLVEAGPTLSRIVDEKKLWDERLIIIHNGKDGDRIFREHACSQES